MLSTSTNLIQRIEELRAFADSPRKFWPALAEVLANLAGACRSRILFRQTNETGQWRRLGSWQSAKPLPALPDVESDRLAERALKEGLAEQSFPGGLHALALVLKTGQPNTECVCLCDLASPSPEALSGAVERLQFIADTPSLYHHFRALQQARADIVHFASALDLLLLLQKQPRFGAAAMAVCNELARRHNCLQVMLGWRQGDYVKVRAISNFESFERKMEAIQKIESAMEECLAQDEEIVWPASEELQQITRDHEILAHQEGDPCLLSVPLRVAEEVAAVLTFQRPNQPFTEDEIRALRIVADQLAPPLDQKRRQDRWFGARWATSLGDAIKRSWSIDHPWPKIGAIAGAIFLAVLFFGHWNYKVEATFILKTEEQVVIPAPFDGFVAEVPVRLGDVVQTGHLLLRLDDSEFHLQKASFQADVRRYQGEAEAARADQQLANMRIALAQRDQSQASLELAGYRIAHAALRAPFPCVVVEDTDLREKIGAPVKTGDSLLRVARLDRLFVQMEILERDIHEIKENAPLRFAFASQPTRKFSGTLSRIEPVAVAKSEKNVFVARGETVITEEWWRPGMTGVAKIEVGPRTFFWIFTHRLVDFLHLKLWF